MTQFLVAATADADMDGILAWLGREGGRALAASYLARFERLFDRLVEFPMAGAERPMLGSGIRIGLVRPFVVIYRYEDAADLLTVLRIVHGRRRMSGVVLGR